MELMENNGKEFAPNKGKHLAIDVKGTPYLRLPIKTPFLTEKDSMMDLIREHVAPHLAPGDMVFVSEKALAITQNQIVKIRDVKPSRLARFLAHRINNHYGTDKFRGFGHSTPAGMELFIREAGVPRVLVAAAAAAVTKPLGIRGAFYLISGKKAKSVDCPMSFILYPYTQYAKLPPKDPSGFAREVKKAFGADTVVVDANYRGVVSLGTSNPHIRERFIYDVFRDNPLGQSDEMTPLAIVRRA